ncbi:hypothetical protein [Methylobacterium pseudosasicola]|uniref:Uncharacterized protein n=1 Tax=Methylobacterium pseudosasicola TaxID=582667 RepID=A0A1I4UR82_9HYPH|nr:hypothetical protein [Methylobacterium pseudosasicola]SFM91428.1 hypothetical protein SAMN05192568_107514 [Methylobacterium pseudosasicola]
MPAARDLTLDEHGVKRAGHYVVTCGVAPAGGIFIVADMFTRLDAEAADHLAALLREHAHNERVVETARLVCAEATR